MNDITGTVALIIQGYNLIKDTIEKELCLVASDFSKKGEIRSRVIGPFEIDTWIYKIEYDDITLEEAIELLLSKVSSNSYYLKQLSKENSVYIKLFIQSEYAQMNLKLSPYILKELSKLNLEINFSIFSWGLVESE